MDNTRSFSKPSEQAKAYGFASLKEVIEITGESNQTLNNWFKVNPRRFELILLGALAKRLIMLARGV